MRSRGVGIDIAKRSLACTANVNMDGWECWLSTSLPPTFLAGTALLCELIEVEDAGRGDTIFVDFAIVLEQIR
jgi:hypothetical protein